MSAGWNAYTGPQDHIGGGAHEPEEDTMNTKQIAEEAADKVDKYFDLGFDNKEREAVIAIIEAAIEKATEIASTSRASKSTRRKLRTRLRDTTRGFENSSSARKLKTVRPKKRLSPRR